MLIPVPSHPLALRRQVGPAGAVLAHRRSMKSFRHLPGAAVEGRVNGHGPGEAGRILDPAGTDPAGAGTGHAVVDRSPGLAGHVGVLGHIEAGRKLVGPVN